MPGSSCFVYRHFHKAVWSEQRFQQLLSSSGYRHDDDNEQPLPSFGARRKLSISFGTPPTTRSHGGSSEHIDGVLPSSEAQRTDGSNVDDVGYRQSRGSLRDVKFGEDTTPQLSRGSTTDVNLSNSATPIPSRGDSTDGEICTPLQRSSDNVFAEDDSNDAFHSKYPSNMEFNNHQLTDLTTRVDTSPQVSKTRQRRPNPLTSHTNAVRTRSHSAVLPSQRESEPWLVTASNRSPLSRQAMICRTQSVFLSGQQQHSPVATKLRTISTSSTLSISPRHPQRNFRPDKSTAGTATQTHLYFTTSTIPKTFSKTNDC